MREYNKIEGVNCKTGASVNIRPVIDHWPQVKNRLDQTANEAYH